jgi:hypothetical protein
MKHYSEKSPQRHWVDHLKGQALVEFALILPFIMLLIIGMIDISRLLITYSAVSSGARAGARFGSVAGVGVATPNYLNCAGIRNAVRSNASALIDLDDSMISINYDRGNNISIGKCGSVSTSQLGPGDRIVVSVTATLDQITPLGLGPFPISFTSARGLFPGVIK